MTLADSPPRRFLVDLERALLLVRPSAPLLVSWVSDPSSPRLLFWLFVRLSGSDPVAFRALEPLRLRLRELPLLLGFRRLRTLPLLLEPRLPELPLRFELAILAGLVPVGRGEPPPLLLRLRLRVGLELRLARRRSRRKRRSSSLLSTLLRPKVLPLPVLVPCLRSARRLLELLAPMAPMAELVSILLPLAVDASFISSPRRRRDKMASTLFFCSSFHVQSRSSSNASS